MRKAILDGLVPEFSTSPFISSAPGFGNKAGNGNGSINSMMMNQQNKMNMMLNQRPGMNLLNQAGLHRF